MEYFIPHIWWTEILFDNLIKWLAKKWYEIKILTTRFEKKLKKVEKLADNIVIYRIWKNRYDFMFKSIFLWIKLARQVDIIHTSTYTWAFPAWIISKIVWKKIVLTVHEVFRKIFYRFVSIFWIICEKYEDLLFSLSFDKYICVSNYTKNSLRLIFWLPDDKLITVYNGIDYNLWNKSNFIKVNNVKKRLNLNKYYSLLFFWRPWFEKWLNYLIKSIEVLKKEIKNIHLFAIVSRNDKKMFFYMKNLVRKLNSEDYITFLEPVEYKELGNYILSVDVVVVPSITEWFWFSAVETCALEKQLVVSNIGSLPEVVSGKINFVEPSNYKDIANKVIDFYNWKFQKINRKEFRWINNIEKTIKVYDSLLSKSNDNK